MKVTRKLPSLGNILAAREPGDKEEEHAPSLYLGDLPKEIEGMPEPGQHFEAHIRGKVRSHKTTVDKMDGEKGGKASHHYDLDVHHLECHGGKKQKKSSREEVDEAMEKHFREK